jgi:gentisate 1,2-dioxygenase
MPPIPSSHLPGPRQESWHDHPREPPRRRRRGRAAVRFSNPTTGGDALTTTMRTEIHRLIHGAGTRRGRTSASSVWQVFSGGGTVTTDGETRVLRHGDVLAVPAWTEFSLQAEGAMDLFTFSDAPVLEKLSLLRTEVPA